MIADKSISSRLTSILLTLSLKVRSASAFFRHMFSRLLRSNTAHTLIRGRGYCTGALQHGTWCKAQRHSWGGKNHSINKTIQWSSKKGAR